MVGVHVGLQRPDELEPQLLEQSGVAPRLLEDRIDENRFPRSLIGEKIGVGGGLLIKELSENHKVS